MNTSPGSKSSDYSEIHDIPILPPQPVARKEYKEEVPDISVVSEIFDNGTQPQNFEGNYLGPQIRSKYFHIQSEFKDDKLSKSDPLLPTPNNFLHGNIKNTSCPQQSGINTCVSKIVKNIPERTILDHNAVLPFTTYFNPGCHSCIINHAVMSNKGCNGQYVLPKSSAPILLPEGNEQSDKELISKSEVREVNSNKICHRRSNHKSIACNHVQLSCPLNSNDPETFQIVDIPDYGYSKDQHSKLRKSLCKCERPATSDSKLKQLRKSVETCEKETVDKNILKDMNIMCPACFKKPCTCKPCACNFSAKEYSENHHSNSDALSSIWEYLKLQDEKINSIHEKVSNFLSQHTSCLIEQPAQVDEISNVAESDIPYILNILEVHSDKIRELQDKINLLKSSEHKSSPANNNEISESVLNQAQTINCVNTETRNEDINCPYSHNVVYHEQRQEVKKTSTSTMTSFIIEKNDIVYCKQITEASGMRDKKESSCFTKKHDSPTTKKYSDEENVNLNSQKRKSHKLNNSSPSLKCKQNVSSNSSSDAPDPNDICHQEFKTSHKSEKKSKRVSTRNKGINKKHTNDVAMKDDVEEKKNSPAMKTAALESHSRSSKQKLRNSTSPKFVDTDTVRDLGNKKMTHQLSASSSSTDTEYKSTNQRQKVFDKIELDSEETEPDSEESTTVSKYGLSSKHLSIATKRYLDTYGLRRT